MDKLGDIELFVTVVKLKGMAIAGRKLGMSPASVTARLNRLESAYGVRLLTRTTRQISLTDEGALYYKHCLKIIEEVHLADESLTSIDGELKGHLKITATVDIGKQYVSPVLSEFVRRHPKVSAHLQLMDHVANLVEGDYDLAIRFGGLADNRMVARRLCANRRVLFASPDYLEKNGTPLSPEDLVNHQCLGLAREDQSLNTWHFVKSGKKTSMIIHPTLTSNDGAMIRQWALDGNGIALKSYLDIKSDVDNGLLEIFMEEHRPDYFSDRDQNSADLFAIYPSKSYLPNRVSHFIALLLDAFDDQ